MKTVLIRNIKDEVHRAIRIQAAHNCRSVEAEIRQILENSIHSPERIKIGSLLVSIAQEAGGLTDEEVERINQFRDKSKVEPIKF